MNVRMCVSVFIPVWWYTAKYILVALWAFAFYNNILIRYWFLWIWNPVFVCVSIFLSVLICVCLWISLLRKLSVFFCLCFRVCLRTCVRVYLGLFVYLCICVYVWSYTHACLYESVMIFFFSFPSFMPRLPEGNGLFQEVGPCVFPPARSRFIYGHRLSRCGCVPKQGPKL